MPEIENPVKMTDEVVKKLEEAFAIDASVEEACFYANISRQTYYNWIESFPDKKERFDSLRQRPVLLARQTVVDNLKSNPDLSLRYLERKKKDEFAPKQTIDFGKDNEIDKTLDGINKILDEKNTDHNTTIQGQGATATDTPSV